ncbi:MAG: radical SAM protein [Nitrospirota bacterium]
MAVYHITYTPKLSELYLYFDSKCNFSCHGCISKYHPQDCHLDEQSKTAKNKTLPMEQVLSQIEPLSIKSVTSLGKEPTGDSDFLPLARILKTRFSSYNTFLTNGWEYVEDEAIDEVCMSIKAITPILFEGWTGRSGPERVLENFKRYATRPKMKVRAESLFVPEYIDRDEIGNIARFIATVDPAIPYRIDGYIPFGIKDRFRKPTKEEMEEVKMVAERYLRNVSILYKGVKVKNKVERIY